jgi:2-oxoglutarate ferredoxin oxidoreductase subunit alpha
VKVSGNEHTRDGHLTEEADVRTRMVNKRAAKIPYMLEALAPPQGYHEESGLLLVGWGSTFGAIKESIDILRDNGHDIGSVHITDVWPFPATAIEEMLGHGKQFFMVELNSTAQMGQLIREQTGLAYQHAILKYDGRPFYPVDIATAVENFLEKQGAAGNATVT